MSTTIVILLIVLAIVSIYAVYATSQKNWRGLIISVVIGGILDVLIMHLHNG